MIYFVRHGQTDWNTIHKCQGHTDIELNNVGISQANSLKEKLKNIRFDLIFSSPLKRALQTAKIITNQKIIIDDRLIERNNGLLEGQTNVNWKEIQSIPGHENKYKLETIASMQKRIFDFFDEILEKYPNKNILIVSHAGVFINAYNYFFKKPLKMSEIKNADYFVLKR